MNQHVTMQKSCQTYTFHIMMDFKSYLDNNKITMWLYATNADKELKNEDMLIHTSKDNNIPIAKLDCTYDTRRLAKKKGQTCACMVILTTQNIANALTYALIQELPSQLLISCKRLAFIMGQLEMLLKLSTKTDRWDKMTNNITTCQTTLQLISHT